ncbi:MAG: hypothetical protein AAGA56_23945 [Myxococcota bacterium]
MNAVARFAPAHVLCAVGCAKSSSEREAEASAKVERTSVAVQLATEDDRAPTSVLISLPQGYDVPGALERLTPALHRSLKACALQPEDTAASDAVLRLDLEGSRVVAATAEADTPLDCLAKQLRQAQLTSPMPSPVDVYIAFGAP